MAFMEHPIICVMTLHFMNCVGSNYFIARISAPKARSDLNCRVLSEPRMAKRLPLSTGTVKSKRFDFALDDDDFEDTPEDFIARIIVLKARSNLNCCILSEQRMAKRPPLSTGTVTSKRFDFALDDDDFEDTHPGSYRKGNRPKSAVEFKLLHPVRAKNG